jgi:hypothetical protein
MFSCRGSLQNCGNLPGYFLNQKHREQGSKAYRDALRMTNHLGVDAHNVLDIFCPQRLDIFDACLEKMARDES